MSLIDEMLVFYEKRRLVNTGQVST
ncbi:Protein of unknown function [Bacillus cytotoxicus]|uniref:Uncharacterized protein n=1 Tax=Bacillus cytotoxicus TaxID=580165 RepID=A0AAX2CFD5_9BACI|nr:Protein of unknown function [Bacillus cytotoxicus]SCN34639.1 Protein of unknown function [Bacillus cytotoxicus]